MPSSPTINPKNKETWHPHILILCKIERLSFATVTRTRLKGTEREIGPKKEPGLHYKAQCDRATSQIPTRHHYNLERAQRQNRDNTDSTQS